MLVNGLGTLCKAFRWVARVPCRVALLAVRAPPIPEVALGLWLEICLDLVQLQPARKVLSNVLWFRLARVSPPKLRSLASVHNPYDLFSVGGTSRPAR